MLLERGLERRMNDVGTRCLSIGRMNEVCWNEVFFRDKLSERNVYQSGEIVVTRF